jgi:hypothetical protein
LVESAADAEPGDAGRAILGQGTVTASWRRLFLVLALCLVVGPPRAAARLPAPAPLAVPVRILVARCPDDAAPTSQAASQPASMPAPVRPRAWVDTHLRAAAEVLGRHGITLQPRVEEFQPERCDLEGRAQRDAMARHVTMDGHATVLVVRRVPDLAVPDHDLMGVHWSAGGGARTLVGRRYVLLAAKARGTVLAHELCHYFGLPHYRRGGNLMTPGPSDPVWRRRGRKPKPHEPILVPAQVRRLRADVAAFLRAHSATGQPRAQRR